MRRTALLVAGSVAFLLGSGGCSGGSYTIVADLGAGVTGAQSVELALVPSCAAQPLGAAPAGASYDAFVRHGQSAQVTGSVMRGTFGLYALARADTCEVVGAGCITVTLAPGGTGELVVPVSPARGVGCATSCDHGRCVSAMPDGGGDAITADAPMTDAPMTDAPPTDADVDAPAPMDGGVDMPVDVDAGDPVLRWNAAIVAGWDAHCACTWMSNRYASMRDCTHAEGEGMGQLDCRVTAAGPVEASLPMYLACVASAEETWVTCETAAACGMGDEGTCNTMRDARITLCPVDDATVLDTFRTAYGDCLAGLVGSGADTCNDGSAPSTALGPAVFSGTNVGAGDNRRPSCAGSGGADVSFHWAAPAAATYVFDTAGSDFDTVLYLLPLCSSAAAAELACDDDSFGVQSSVTIALTAMQTVEIVVDGYATENTGHFVVNIASM